MLAEGVVKTLPAYGSELGNLDVPCWKHLTLLVWGNTSQRARTSSVMQLSISSQSLFIARYYAGFKDRKQLE